MKLVNFWLYSPFLQRSKCSLYTREENTGYIWIQWMSPTLFSSVLTLAEVKKQFEKHVPLIFKFPLRFKRNLIHMFLIHLHSTHKKSSSIWSHCGPGALKSFKWAFLLELKSRCCVLSALSKFETQKSLGHKWEGTDGFEI